MPFIGKPPVVGAYSVLDDLTASATANYSLQLNGAAFVPNSVNQLLVSLNGVIQKPGSSFVVSGSTLTFKNGNNDQALTSSDSIDFIISMGGDPLNVGVVSDGTITNSKVANGISSSKLTGALPAISGESLTNLTRSSVTNSVSGAASSSITGLSTTAKKITLLTHDISTSTSTNVRMRVRGNSADETGTVYSFNSFYIYDGSNNNFVQGANTDYFSWHSGWAGASNTYNLIVDFYKVGTGLYYNFHGIMYNRGVIGVSNYSTYNTQFQGRILPSNLIDGITIYTADGANFDSGTMTVITNE